MTTTSYNIYQQITSVRLGAVTNVPGNYFNGALNNGVGSTLTALVQGKLIVNGVVADLGDRILLFNQTNTNENGIYFVNAAGGTSSLWQLQRADDFQSAEQLKAGQYFSVGAGNTLAGAMFVLVEPLPSSIGSIGSNFNFVDVSSGGIPPGPYLTVAGNLSDVENTQDSFSNLGLGSGNTLFLSDADFTAGVYQLTLPWANYVVVSCVTPGNQVRLPISNSVMSPSLSQGPEIQVVQGFQAIDVATFSGVSLVSLTPASPGNSPYAQFVLTSKSTSDGSWDVNFLTKTVNDQSGIAVITDQSTYDFSATGNVNLSTGKHVGYTATDAGFYLPVMSDSQFDAIPLPPKALMAWETDTNRIRTNRGTTLLPVYDDVAFVSDITSSVPVNTAYGEMYFNGNATNTTFAGSGVPTKVNTSAYVSGSLLNFTQAAGTLTYSGIGTQEFEVVTALTVTALTIPIKLTFNIYKNGVALPNIIETINCDGVIPSLKSVTLSCLVALTSGDNLQVFVTNDLSNTAILVQDFNTSVNSVSGTSAGASGTYTPTATGNVGFTLPTAFLSMFSTISTVVGNICTVTAKVNYTPTLTSVSGSLTIPPGIGGVFTNAGQAMFVGGQSFITSTFLTPSDYKNFQANVGTNQVIVTLQVPPAAVGLQNTIIFTFSYVIQ